MAVRADLFIGAPSQLLSVANLIDTNPTRANGRSKVDSMIWKSVGFAKIAGSAAHPNRSVSLVAASSVRGEIRHLFEAGTADILLQIAWRTRGNARQCEFWHCNTRAAYITV